MFDIFVQTLPFFALIALGYLAARTGFFSTEATAYLTKFVFYFALSAMLFRFSAELSVAEVFDLNFVLAYLAASFVVYGLVTGIARVRGVSPAGTAFEAQCAVVGNVGFLGIPMLAVLMGPQAVGPVVLVLSCDLLIFATLLVVMMTVAREGRVSPALAGTLALGILRHPMLMSLALGFAWGATGVPLAAPVTEFLTMLGAAATPCALFAIGASLAAKSAERVEVAAWLSFAKLVLHPAAVAVAALWLFEVDRFAAGVMIAAAALPVAGNVYILAQHYEVAPQRVSAAILMSTAFSVVTVSLVVAWVAVG